MPPHLTWCPRSFSLRCPFSFNNTNALERICAALISPCTPPNNGHTHNHHNQAAEDPDDEPFRSKYKACELIQGLLRQLEEQRLVSESSADEVRRCMKLTSA